MTKTKIETFAILACVAAVAAACKSSEDAGANKHPADKAQTAPATAPAPTEQQPTPAAKPPVAGGDLLRAAVDNPARPAEDRARDAARKPYDVLTFFGIKPGMKVAEMMTGAGYYVEILARAVGPEGHVYAQNNKFVLERFAEEPLSKRLAHPDMANVTRLDHELEDPGLPAGELDAVLMVLFYHDTYWMGADRAKMNKAIFESLKPGGVFGVIDHHAAAGSGDRDVKTIHRVDAELVKREILAAGFELDAESDLLRHPEDDRTLNVFDSKIRGNTDRFVYRFRRPAAK